VKIAYVTGDATAPLGAGPKLIVHVCNDAGRWGKGFVLAISRRWKTPELVYKDAFKRGVGRCLGDVQFVQVAPDIVVANVIGQAGIRNARNETSPPPIRYEAIEQGLKAVADEAARLSASVHMPRIGCGLAGGDWRRIEPIITEQLIDRGIPTIVYDLAKVQPALTGGKPARLGQPAIR